MIAPAAADPGNTAVQKVADALAGKPQELAAARILDRWLSMPLLFQIGRTAPESLQPNDKSNAPCKLNDLLDCSIRPDAPKLYPELSSGAVVGATYILTILLLAVTFSIRPSEGSVSPSSSVRTV